LRDSAPKDQLDTLESKRKDSFQRIDAALRDGVAKLPRLVMANDQQAPVRAAAFSPDGRYLATAADHKIFLSEIPSDPATTKSQKSATTIEYKGAVSALAFSP